MKTYKYFLASVNFRGKFKKDIMFCILASRQKEASSIADEMARDYYSDVFSGSLVKHDKHEYKGEKQT